MNTNNLYGLLLPLIEKPAVWSRYTACELWTSEHTSKKMLEHHLDSESWPSSRPHAFIDRSARWINESFDIAGKKVLDLGCGPGLYTSRFCAAGAQVCGVDFSRRSIDYAKSQAMANKQSIEYRNSNYLDLEEDGQYDLVTMIYCDYCALSPSQRKELLSKVHKALVPGGSFLFDVFNLQAFTSRQENSEIAPRLMDGFWAPDDYIGMRQTWKYEDEQVILDKYDIFREDGHFSIYNWLQYFDIETLKAQLDAAGFAFAACHADVAGTPLPAAVDTFAVTVVKH